MNSEDRIKKKNKKVCVLFSVLWFLSSVLCLISCSNQSNPPDSNAAPKPQLPLAFNASPIVLSILPVESAGAMYERFVPLKYYLENVLKRPVIIKVAKDYETAIHEIGNGQVHMACLDPATYCEVRARYKNKVVPLVRPIGKEGATSRSVLAVKDNSGIEKVADVKGRRLALGNAFMSTIRRRKTEAESLRDTR